MERGFKLIVTHDDMNGNQLEMLTTVGFRGAASDLAAQGSLSLRYQTGSKTTEIDSATNVLSSFSFSSIASLMPRCNEKVWSNLQVQMVTAVMPLTFLPRV